MTLIFLRIFVKAGANHYWSFNLCMTQRKINGSNAVGLIKNFSKQHKRLKNSTPIHLP